MGKHVGRHRAPGYSPLQEIGQLAVESTKPALQVSAVAVASTGLVATMALPAYAAPATPDSGSAAAAPAVPFDPMTDSTDIIEMGPVVVAPTASAAQLSVSSLAGFKAKAVSVAAPAPATRVSRSTSRTAAPASPAAPEAPAAPVVPVNGSIIAIAASLTGIPYVRGGTSTSGADCSGFTQLVYRLAGKSIPRTAEAQRAGSVKVSNPQPGDLVFFGYPATHVGIYAGNGMMYDSARTGTRTALRKIYSSNVVYGRY